MSPDETNLAEEPCIKQTRESLKTRTWCGRNALAAGWCYVSIDHAVNNLANAGRLGVCPACLAAVRVVLGDERAAIVAWLRTFPDMRPTVIDAIAQGEHFAEVVADEDECDFAFLGDESPCSPSKRATEHHIDYRTCAKHLDLAVNNVASREW